MKRREETFEEYGKFQDSLLIEELIKEFNFDCKLEYVKKKRFGGSKITTYYFRDELGIIWDRDVSDRAYYQIICRNPKMRARRV